MAINIDAQAAREMHASDSDTLPERARPLLRAMAQKAAVDYPAAPLNDPAVVSIATPYRQFPSVRAQIRVATLYCWPVSDSHVNVGMHTMQQPVVRARGRYAADDAISAAAAAKGADAANLVCNKNFAAKRALTAGVFTVVCPHGTFA